MVSVFASEWNFCPPIFSTGQTPSSGGRVGWTATSPDFSYSRRAADRGFLQPVDSARVPRAAGTPTDWTTCRLGAPASGRHRSAPAERNRTSLLLPDGACTRHALLLWWQRAFRFASLRDAGWKPALRGPDGDSPDGSDTASTGASGMRYPGQGFSAAFRSPLRGGYHTAVPSCRGGSCGSGRLVAHITSRMGTIRGGP